MNETEAFAILEARRAKYPRCFYELQYQHNSSRPEPEFQLTFWPMQPGAGWHVGKGRNLEAAMTELLRKLEPTDPGPAQTLDEAIGAAVKEGGK